MARDLQKRIQLLQMGEAQGRLKPEHAAELEEYRRRGLAGATRGEMQAAKRDLANDKMFSEASSVIGDIENARNLLGATRLGQIGRSVGQFIPGAPAYALDKALDSVRANVGFSKLAEMRNASASGASGLGQLTEKERKALETVLGSLDIAQPEDQLRRSLNKIEYHQRRLRMIAEGKVPPPYNEEEAASGRWRDERPALLSSGSNRVIRYDANGKRLP